MRVLAAVLAVLVSVPCLGAGTETDPDNRKAAEELFGLLKADKAVAQIRDQMQAMIATQIRTMNIPDNMRERSVLYQQQMVDLIFSELNPTKLKPDYIEAYASTFSAEELAGLVAFFKTASGQAYVEKMPSITRKMIDVAQVHVQALAPQLQKMQDEFTADLRSAAAAHKDAP